jgi:hypothetical protein
MLPAHLGQVVFIEAPGKLVAAALHFVQRWHGNKNVALLKQLPAVSAFANN